MRTSLFLGLVVGAVQCSSFVSVPRIPGFFGRTTLKLRTRRHRHDKKRTPNKKTSSKTPTPTDERRRQILAFSSSSALSLLITLPCGASSHLVSDMGSLVPPKTSDSAEESEILPYSTVRRTKRLRLANGLNVILVSDQRAQQSSVALSITGAGQFADGDIPGTAHLMEHMILSTPMSVVSTDRGSKKNADFEDWLADNDGVSNAFTAYDYVCFHFSCPDGVVGDALRRFAPLFYSSNARRTCLDSKIVTREMYRVDEELDFSDTSTQCVYLAKDFVNPEHPYSKFSRGNRQSLDRWPRNQHIDIGQTLVDFFDSKYLANCATLVVVSPQEFFTQERWITPFSYSLITTSSAVAKAPAPKVRNYPGGFLLGNRPKHLVLYRKSNQESDRIVFHWILNLDYSKIQPPPVTANAVAFCLSQVLCRRGPGSLLQYLRRRSWVSSTTTQGSPRITVPVDVSQFQLIKMEIGLTRAGVVNRAGVVSAVYATLEKLRQGDSYKAPRQIVRQYMNIAKLHGYILSPRPADSVELAVDAAQFGLSTVASGEWYRVGRVEVLGAIQALQRALGNSIESLADPDNAVIIATANPKLVSPSEFPPLSSSKWLVEPIAGGRFFFDDSMQKRSLSVESLMLSRLVNQEELSGYLVNTLVPPFVRPSRTGRSVPVPDDYDKFNGRLTLKPSINDASRYDSLPRSWRALTEASLQRGTGLDLLRGPPEPSCRSAFVLQLISSRPARANVRSAARAELWLLSFERAVVDLAELGAPGALAYDISFNKFGLRLCFLGISQTLPSYARRLSRALVQHHLDLLQGPEMFPRSLTNFAVSSAKQAPGLSMTRRLPIISNLRAASAYDAAAEGNAFLRSCAGAVCFAQGDLLPNEVQNLLVDLHDIFSPALGSGALSTSAAIPSLHDLIYKPRWKPRSGSSCAIPGVVLLSDACGRLPH